MQERKRREVENHENVETTVSKPTGLSSANGTCFKAPWQNPTIRSCGRRGREYVVEPVIGPRSAKVMPNRAMAIPKRAQVA
eukprot:1867617-Pyramimonas_sp.AAC.2